LRTNTCFTDQSNGDRNGTEQQRLPSADSIEEEDDEDQVEKWANNVVDPGDEQRAVALYAKIVVHDRLVVADDVDTENVVSICYSSTKACSPCHLPEELDRRCVQQSGAPSRDLEHDRPTWRRDSLLGFNGELDLVELLVDPVLVGPVIMQLVQDSQRLITAVSLNEVPGTFWKEHDAENQQKTGDALDRERKAPGERAGIGYLRGSVAHPCRDDETNTDHLLGDTDNQTLLSISQISLRSQD
jgi:hypothetical protein